MNRRYPWLSAYGAVSAVVAVVGGSLSFVAAFAIYLALVERGEGLAALAAVGVATGGLFAAIVIGAVADIVRWMFDVVRLLGAYADDCTRQ